MNAKLGWAFRKYKEIKDSELLRVKAGAESILTTKSGPKRCRPNRML